MSILVNQKTRLVVQGITGREGQFHTSQMLEYGTKIVAGVTPGKGGDWIADVPVFDTVLDAVKEKGANCSIIYVPARFSSDAILEAADSGIKLIVCITEGIPVHDMIKVRAHLDSAADVQVIGPNSPGIISPGETKVGIMPGHIHKPGSIGVVSRSGTLTYEVVHALSNRGLGQSTVVGIGGDPIIGTDFIDILECFEKDPKTTQIILIGEIGGTDEQRAAEYIALHISKPVIAFVAGQTAPPSKRMGHAGAIVEGDQDTAIKKISAFKAVGVHIAQHPVEIADLVAKLASSAP